eukprot:TRINITY_DN13295_c0_g1_i1.p1 TRINITY_DN13295_c0_g1~~TRINITY_DN13295_c0_g1_i1.p1  ORF type:complete len:737 (+),score=136.76 TRINITY_DN13295_c0_g1_i1:32-2242(+)
MSSSVDKGVLTRKLGASDYSPAKYVAEISQRCVGGEEVLAHRKLIQDLSDETSALLKQNVYQNYSQFIQTAKEISHLESDMYRLSSMITDQRKFLNGLMETSILGDTVPMSHTLNQVVEEVPKEVEGKPSARKEEGRRLLVDLMENVEGGREIIDIPNRFLLYHGDLIEMDINDHSALHRVHIYLTNDSIIIATWLRERRGPVRFKISSEYGISGCAMVNVRDLAGIPNAWKLLVTPEPRLFQCKDNPSKKEWLSAYEEAKEWQKHGGRPPPQPASKLSTTSSILGLAGMATSQRNSKLSSASESKPSVASRNPFASDTNEERGIKDENTKKEPDLPEWLEELPDVLDVHIAQREFESAMELVKDAEVELERRGDGQTIKDLKEANQARKEALIQVLRGELTLTPDKSMQGGPRTARRAVFILSGLGRGGEATDLFLSHRTAILRHNVKSCRVEGNTNQYIKRIGNTFFQQISETAREFDKCFSGGENMSGTSLLVWLDSEVQWFADILDKQMFSNHSPLPTVAESVSRLRTQAKKLLTLGLDVVFLLDNRLQSALERIICEARDKAVEAVKLRWGEETWQPHNPPSKAAMDKCIAELNEAGVASISTFLNKDGGLDLTSNSVSFGLSYLTLTNHLLLLYTPGTRHLVNESLVSVLHAQLRHLDQAVRSDKVEDISMAFITKNSVFLLDTILTLVEHRYQKTTGNECPKLSKLHTNYSWLKEGNGPVTKYQDNNYL